MAQEIELKLSIPLEFKEKLIKHPLLAACLKKPVTTQQLFNRYFDTANGDLNQHRIALRIRKAGARYIQTLKTRGTSQGGLHSRNEWEWPLTRPELDFSLLPAEALPEDLDFSALSPLFDTDFQRTTWHLDYNNTELELVLDLGQVGLPQDPSQYHDALHEIELELLKGEPLALFDLAIELAQDMPLRITQISKAERGYRLLRHAKGTYKAPALSAANSCGEALENGQATIEAFLYQPSTTNQNQLLQNLKQLETYATANQQIVLARVANEASQNDYDSTAFYDLEFCRILLELARENYLS